MAVSRLLLRNIKGGRGAVSCNCQPAGSIWTDEFETNDFSAWDLNAGASTTQNVVKKYGSYAMKCAFSGAWQGPYAQKTIGGAPDTDFLGFWFLFDGWPDAQFEICDTRDTGFAGIGTIFMEAGGTGITFDGVTFPFAFALNTWYRCLIKYVKSVAVGEHRLWLGSTEVITVVGENNPNSFGDFQLGRNSLFSGTTFNVYYDCVVFRASYYAP